MSKFILAIILLFSFSLSAHAARKGSPRKQPPIDRQGPTEDCPSYGCSEDTNEDSGSDTYVPGRTETYEDGGDRDTGSDYINGMPY